MKNIPVIMVRPHMRDITQYALPEGMTARRIRGDQLCLWTDIWRDAEPFEPIGEDLIMREFGQDMPGFCLRCLMVFNKKGCAVATATAWYSDDFRQGRWGRIHWVATRPAWQGRGIARGLMTRVMNLMADHHDKAWLATSSARLGAIKIYLDFGFEPVWQHPGGREAWPEVARRLTHPLLERGDGAGG